MFFLRIFENLLKDLGLKLSNLYFGLQYDTLYRHTKQGELSFQNDVLIKIYLQRLNPSNSSHTAQVPFVQVQMAEKLANELHNPF